MIRVNRSALLGALLASAPCPALAQDAPPIDLSADLTVDTVTLLRGGSDHRARVLTNLDVIADADLDQLIGWNGTRAHVHVIDNRGGRPNDAAGTLQGVDNIEVPASGTRLFEAWVEHDLPGGGSVLAGLYDVNSEFYANESAGLLVAPPFGIGSEFAATGPNGPSIFPSTALALRLRLPVAHGRGRVQVAVLNAHARTLGDFGGIDFSFHDGLLLVGEAGLVEGPVHASIGGWAYTGKRDDVYRTDIGGDPLQRSSQGGYALVEATVAKRDDRQLSWFLRAGISEGHTSPFSGGFQTGFLLAPALADRPGSALSVGMHQAWINNAFRQLLADDGTVASDHEQAFAASYADEIMAGLGIQGDVQWIRHPGGDAAARDAMVTTLRLTISL